MDVGVTECGALASPNATVQQLGDNPTKTVIPAKAGTHVMFNGRTRGVVPSGAIAPDRKSGCADACRGPPPSRG